jgi:2-haloacid dehalogenase
MRRVQVFDVNETLLDLAAMDRHFQRIFGDGGARVAWFNQMIQSALVATVTGAYRPFGALGMAALEMTAERAGVRLTDRDREAVAAPRCGSCRPIPRWTGRCSGCATPGCGWPR